MKRIQNRLGSLCMAVVMLLSMAVTPAMAADTKDRSDELRNERIFHNSFGARF